MYLVSSYLVSVFGEGKKIAHPLKNQGWDTKKQYSTVPPWLPCTAEPLIDAVTGAPGRPFPACGSEVVTLAAGVRVSFTNAASSLGILPERVSSSKPFYVKI